jgi:hypothetical protein
MVQLVDDLDGSQSDDITTVSFGLDGANYEIDLSAVNAEQLRKALYDFVGHARRTGGRIKRGAGAGSGSATTTGHEQAQAIRDWARRNNFEVSDRGRIPGSIIEAFEAAQTESTAKTRKRKTKATAT